MNRTGMIAVAGIAVVLVAGLWFALSGGEKATGPVSTAKIETGPAASVNIGGLPEEPLIVDLESQGLALGQRGGTLRMMLAKEKDVRLMNVWGYARLIGWSPRLNLEPDIASQVEVIEGRIFTFRLRKGHKWSDGAPFTSEDFRYFWEDIANNKDLTPAGPPSDLLNNGSPPVVTFPDSKTIVFQYETPNPRFLTVLAQAREPYIYRPAHYLKQFHAKYAKPGAVEQMAKDAKVSGWAALHNRRDSMDDADNPDMPTLQPWVVATAMPAAKFLFKRNPHFHRADRRRQQLPYIDTIEVSITDDGLIAAKAAAGDADLQARGLNFSDLTILKQNEAKGGYKVHAWPIGKGSQLALYPNLNASDPVWRALNRDIRFRRALSLGINRADINATLFFGLGVPGSNAMLEASPLFDRTALDRDAEFNVTQANTLLDETGLAKRGSDGTRLLPDGRPAEIIVDSAGESKEEGDVLQLITEHWKALGLKLVIKTSDRAVFRNRVYAGEAILAAWGGWNNGIATADMSPDELAPTAQDLLQWPKWGQHYETKGTSGEAPDIAEAQELIALNTEWSRALSAAERKRIWGQMIQIHTEQRFIIGTVAGVGQPVLVSNRLQNVPEKGVWSWDPGAQWGMYRPDQFWIKAP